MSSRLLIQRLFLVILVVAGIMLGIGHWAEWYAVQVSVPRFCRIERPVLMDRFLRIITKEHPAGDKKTRPYIIVAKLMFLVPRQAGETVAPYLARVENHLDGVCR